VPRGGAPRPLPAADARADLLSVPVTRMDRTPGASSASTVGDVLADTYTDAYLVLQDGALVTEWYGPLGAPDRPHALMSVTKSVVGCVAAVLIDRGDLDPDAEVTAYVPELAGSGFAGALVRQIYDMRSGVRFLEEYANPDSDIRRLDEWVGWQPGQGEPRGLHRFLATLQAEAPHGERFLYRSAESDVLGWVCERAAGRPMAELISELIWAPMGAEHDAILLHDGLGAAVHDGGLCATARDVARFGQMLLDGGLAVGAFCGIDEQRRKTGEVFRAGLDGIDPSPLAFAETGRRKEIADGQNSGQRRPDLVRERRERRLHHPGTGRQRRALGWLAPGSASLRWPSFQGRHIAR